jgi:16S rRNA processing protein RimM
MVTLEGLNNINDVIMYKGDSVYINRDDIKIDGYFNEDIIGLSVISNNENKGIVKNILKNKAHDILFIEDNGNNHMVPFVDEFIEKIDLEDKKIYIKEMKGLFDED